VKSVLVSPAVDSTDSIAGSEAVGRCVDSGGSRHDAPLEQHLWWHAPRPPEIAHDRQPRDSQPGGILQQPLGGLRRPDRALSQMPARAASVGSSVRTFFEHQLSSVDGLENMIFKAITDKTTPDRSSTLGAEFWSKVDQVAVRLGEFLGATSSANVTDTINDVDTPIRADILQRWGELAGDPGARLASWLKFGAPAGISMDMDQL